MNKERKILITGTGFTDPFTRMEPKTEEEKYSYYLDGPILSILRKAIDDKKPFTHIYIFLTDATSLCREILRIAIEKIYANYNISSPQIVFNNIDRKKVNVDKFNESYEVIKESIAWVNESHSVDNKPEVVVNLSSGTSGFKANLLLMAVTNNYDTQETLDPTKLKDVGEKYIGEKYNIRFFLQSGQGPGIVEELEIDSNSENAYSYTYPITEDNVEKTITIDTKKLESWIKKLNESEERFQQDILKIQRSIVDDTSETKRIVLLESVKDSIKKHDYCGLYNSIINSKNFLEKVVDYELLNEKVSNLYYRYIGNDDNSGFNKWQQDDSRLNRYYPIYNISSSDKKLLNNIIEKFNILKIKSLREEINDWALIVTPLNEAILKGFLKVGGIDIEKCSKINSEDEIIIDSEKLEAELRKNDIGNHIVNNQKYYDFKTYRSLYSYLYNIYDKKNGSDNDVLKKSVSIYDVLRVNRNISAHEIKNINKTDVQTYFNKILNSKKESSEKLKEYINTNKENPDASAIDFIEITIKHLIIKLVEKQTKIKLKDNEELKRIVQDSLNIYAKLENEIVEILEKKV